MDYSCSKRIDRWGNILCVLGILLALTGVALIIFAIMGGMDYTAGIILFAAGILLLPASRCLNGLSLLVYDAEHRLNDRAQKE